MASTLYNLFCPIAILKLMQHRLTLVDLSVEPEIKTQYTLLKNLYVTFTDDFDLAKINPQLKYDPFNPNWLNLRKIDSRQHWRQGLPVGRLDSALETLIMTTDGVSRIISFGEFETAFNDSQSKLHKEFQLVADIFIGFHPKGRPILWRILIVQAHIFKAIIEFSNKETRESGTSIFPLKSIPQEKRQAFDWRISGDQDPEADIPFEVAQQYFAMKATNTVV